VDEHTHEEMLFRIATLEDRVAELEGELEKRVAALEAAFGLGARRHE
jgi:uncharacterized small protein (DUF1192 family)